MHISDISTLAMMKIEDFRNYFKKPNREQTQKASLRGAWGE